MSGASTSTYPENLVSGGQLPAELRGRVCLFLSVFFLFVRHAPARSTVYGHQQGKHRSFQAQKAQTVRICIEIGGGDGHKPPGQKPSRTKIPQTKSPPGQKTRGEKVPSGDIFYCSGSRQLNHSSLRSIISIFFWLRIRSLTSLTFAVVRVVLYGVPPYRYLDQSYTFHSHV